MRMYLDDFSFFPYLMGSLKYFLRENQTSFLDLLHTLFLFSIKNFSEASIFAALKALKKRGYKEAVIWSGGKRTYYEVFERAAILSYSLLELGTIPGKDKLAFMSINIPQSPEIWYCCSLLELSFIPVNWRLKSQELKYIYEHSGANIFIYNKDNEDEVKKADLNAKISISLDEGFENFYENIIYDTRKKLNLSEKYDVEKRIEKISEFIIKKLQNIKKEKKSRERTKDGEKLGIMVYTSGTTGKPKGARRKVNPVSVMLLASSAAREFGLRRDNIHLVVSPLYHSAPFFFAQLTLAFGGTLVILPRFRVEPFFEAIHRYKTTSTFIVPYMLYEILENYDSLSKIYDISSVSHFICGAAPLSPEKKREFIKKMGSALYEFYGSTETSINSILKPQDIEKKAESVGKVVPFCRIKIVDDNGKVCGVNQEGLIYVRSPFAMEGYYKDKSATDEITFDGYITAGDVGKIDEDGFLYILDRKKDMIISAGVNIYPAEIENEILKHNAVKLCAVVGVHDEKWGERVKAFVVLKDGFKVGKDELEAFLRERIAGYKIPREWEFVDSLPMNPSGKILKRELIKKKESKNIN